MERLYQVRSKYFTAGIVFKYFDSQNTMVCIKAAPILHYMVSWDIYKVAAYCKRKQWEVIRADTISMP